MSQPKLYRLLDDRDLDFSLLLTKGALVDCLVSNGFDETQIVPYNDIKPFRSFSDMRQDIIKRMNNYKRWGSARLAAECHYNRIYGDNDYCWYHVRLPHSIFNNYYDMIKNLDFGGLVRRSLKEILIILLDYVEIADHINNSLKRTFAADLNRCSLRMSDVLYKCLQCLILNLDVNFPSRAVIVRDELSFAAGGFGGVIMAMDFRPIVLDKQKRYMLLGTNYHGQLRHFEILEGNQSEYLALQSSLWYKHMANEAVNFPAAFKVRLSETESVLVPSVFLFDQQISGKLVTHCNVPRIMNHVIVPSHWRKSHLGHDMVRDYDASLFASKCENARFSVERSSLQLVGSLCLSANPSLRGRYPDWNDTVFKFRVLNMAFIRRNDPFHNRKDRLDQKYKYKSEAVEKAEFQSTNIIQLFLRVFESGEFMLDREVATVITNKPSHYVSNMVAMDAPATDNCLVLEQDEYMALTFIKCEFSIDDRADRPAKRRRIDL